MDECVEDANVELCELDVFLSAFPKKYLGLDWITLCPCVS